MAPAAPGLFTATTGTGINPLAAYESWRAIWSAEPPGANPTRMVMGCVGVHSCCAQAGAAAAASRPSVAWRRLTPVGIGGMGVSCTVFCLQRSVGPAPPGVQYIIPRSVMLGRYQARHHLL